MTVALPSGWLAVTKPMPACGFSGQRTWVSSGMGCAPMSATHWISASRRGVQNIEAVQDVYEFGVGQIAGALQFAGDQIAVMRMRCECFD